VQNLDVVSRAGGRGRTVDLVFDNLLPSHGAIEIRLEGARRPGPKGLVQGEAFIQALEIGPGSVSESAHPGSSPP
jgi:hypothetical protein